MGTPKVFIALESENDVFLALATELRHAIGGIGIPVPRDTVTTETGNRQDGSAFGITGESCDWNIPVALLRGTKMRG